MRAQPPDFGLSAQPLKGPPACCLLGMRALCQWLLLNSKGARLCVLKFIDPSPSFLARMEGMRPRHSRQQ